MHKSSHDLFLISLLVYREREGSLAPEPPVNWERSTAPFPPDKRPPSEEERKKKEAKQKAEEGT